MNLNRRNAKSRRKRKQSGAKKGKVPKKDLFAKIFLDKEEPAVRLSNNAMRCCELIGGATTWPHGQAVKTPPFHGGIMGSNPVGVTKNSDF